MADLDLGELGEFTHVVLRAHILCLHSESKEDITIEMQCKRKVWELQDCLRKVLLAILYISRSGRLATFPVLKQ